MIKDSNIDLLFKYINKVTKAYEKQLYIMYLMDTVLQSV